MAAPVGFSRRLVGGVLTISELPWRTGHLLSFAKASRSSLDEARSPCEWLILAN